MSVEAIISETSAANQGHPAAGRRAQAGKAGWSRAAWTGFGSTARQSILAP